MSNFATVSSPGGLVKAGGGRVYGVTSTDDGALGTVVVKDGLDGGNDGNNYPLAVVSAQHGAQLAWAPNRHQEKYEFTRGLYIVLAGHTTSCTVEYD